MKESMALEMSDALVVAIDAIMLNLLTSKCSTYLLSMVALVLHGRP